MQYIVKRQYARGTETSFAEFTDLNDAKLFVETKLASDAAMNVNVIYRITEFGDVLHEYDSSKFDSAASTTTSQGKGSTFSPTPFNTTPRPSGTPPKWIKDEDEGEKK